MKLLYDNKVYLTPYWEMQAPMGWFRVVFSVYSDEDFQIGKWLSGNFIGKLVKFCLFFRF